MEASTTNASGITVRRLLVDFGKGFPRWWHSGNPYLSHYWNSFSLLFPLAERHMIDVTRDCLAKLESVGPPELVSDVRAFIGQESAHRHVHVSYNQVLEAQGYRNVLEPILRIQLRCARRLPLSMQVAMAAALEHWTATIADFYLEPPTRIEGMHDLPRRVWEWHGAEETEHKNVQFDVYRHMGGGYWLRIFAFFLMTMILFFDLLYQRTALLWHDRVWHRPRTWLDIWRAWFGRRGMAWHHAPHLMAYFRPSFHPNQHDSRELLDGWKERAKGHFKVVKEPVSGISPFVE